MKRFAFLSTFLLCSFLLFAQSNFLAGTITKSSGEVVNGFVDYKEWSKNPSAISFKKSLDENATSYSVDDLTGFEITGKEKYIRARIKKDMMPVKVQDFNVLPAEKVVSETAFVRELFRNDRIGLYIYRDFKDHFYVSEGNAEFVELVYSIKPTDADVVENNIFRDQLLTYFPELRTDTKVKNKLEHLKYKEDDLTQFFYAATNTKAKSVEKIKPVFFAGTGAAITTLKMSSDFSDVAVLDYKTTISPILYAGVDFITKRNRGAFVFRPQLSFYNLNYEGTYIRNHPAGYQEEIKHVLKMSNFGISLGGLYNFWNKPKQKVYGGLEVVGNISSYSKNEFTEYNLMEFESSWFTVNAMAGAIFMKRFEIGVSARLTGSFSAMDGINAKPSIYLVKLGYRF